MTREPHDQFDAPPIEAGRQVARLRALLARARALAGDEQGGTAYDTLDEAARISAAYDAATPVQRRRFDAFAEEATTWSPIAFDALTAVQAVGGDPAAAAGQVARDLDGALRDLVRAVQAR